MHLNLMQTFKEFQNLLEGKKKIKKYQKEIEKSVKKQIESGANIINYDHPTKPPSAPGSPERDAEIRAMMQSQGEKAIKKHLKNNS